MATTVTHIVDPDSGAGYDYDSLFDWEVGEQGDLTGVRDEISVAKCQCTGGTADTTAVTIDGWITSTTQYIKIWTDPAESYRHNGTYQTGNKYRLEVTNAVAIIAYNEDYGRIFGLQFYTLTPTGNGKNGLTFDGLEVGRLEVAYNIFRGHGSASYTQGLIVINETNNTIYIWNNILYPGCTTVNTYCIGVSNATDIYLYNNTIVGGDYNILLASGILTTFNNIYQGATYAAVYCFGTGSVAAASDYNATNRNAFGFTANTHDHVSHTFTFVGAADFHLASTDVGAIDLGVSDPGSGLFSDDIDGVTRGATWDIGADEYVAAVSAISISISESLAFAEALD